MNMLQIRMNTVDSDIFRGGGGGDFQRMLSALAKNRNKQRRSPSIVDEHKF